ncbi:MAG: APC family permease [Phreatobacter sp.]|nr:APC family permease [Phreatobacter sp.]
MAIMRLSSPTPPPAGKLARDLTLAHAVLYGLGITIGAGIYVLVGLAAGRSGMHAPLAFVLAALVMGFSAATFAELGTRLPVAASEAAYVEEAFRRRRLALAVGLLSVATSVVSAATISAGAAGYIAVFLPLPGPVLIAGAILVMGAIAMRATVQSVGFAGAMTIVEVAGLAVIVAAGLTHPDIVTRLPEMTAGLGSGLVWAGIGSTALLAVFAFIGFEHLVNISEEMKDQRRTLPRALFATLGLTAVLYALVVWIAVVAVPPQDLAASGAPLALVFERLTGWPFAVMSAVAVAATLNGLIVNMIIIGRVLYGLADRGQLPAILARVHPRSQAPVVATAVGVALILVLALAIPLAGLADLASKGTILIFVIVNVALVRIKLREKRPPEGVFVCPIWVPVCGVLANLGLLAADFAAQP